MRIAQGKHGGGWPWSHTSFYQVEGAPGPSPLGTGEEEPNRL
jgi:hypothetical protein